MSHWPSQYILLKWWCLSHYAISLFLQKWASWEKDRGEHRRKERSISAQSPLPSWERTNPQTRKPWHNVRQKLRMSRPQAEQMREPFLFFRNLVKGRIWTWRTTDPPRSTALCRKPRKIQRIILCTGVWGAWCSLPHISQPYPSWRAPLVQVQRK